MQREFNSTQKHKVFVYGTLRRYNSAAADPDPDATHVLQGYALYDAGEFPYIDEYIGGAVYGNVIVVDDKRLAALDAYEGVDRGLYTRETVQVWGKDVKQWKHGAEPDTMFAYVASDALRPRPIVSGDWFNKGE